jgi:two-component system response regulator GlrR
VPAAGDAAPGSTRSLGADATDDSHALVRRFRLVVTQGPDAGAEIVSKRERTIIGTHESSDFRLSDETVSRFHCEIEPGTGRAIVRDLGSRNGTKLDGVSVLAAHLHPGARLRLGRTELVFEPRSDAARLPISERTRFGRLVGASLPMRRVFWLLEQAASSDATLLIEGETGTGKELAAEAVHEASARRSGPFVVVDCGAIPAQLLESELFGHERGAFTGAVASREGAFEAAAGGSLFLDEIGELPAELQPKLLRALDRRQVKRIGANHHTAVDVRVIAATNRNLREEVNSKRFRADLYYRLAILQVRLVPLRERLDDLADLSSSLLDDLCVSYPSAAPLARSHALNEELARHQWPGNVRELKNFLESLLALGASSALPADRTQPALETSIAALSHPDQPLKVARERWTRACERHYLQAVLGQHGGNVAAAARAASVDRMHFYRLLWRHGLK